MFTKKNRVRNIIVVVVVAAVVILWFRLSPKEQGPTIKTADVGRGDIVAGVSGNGTLEPITIVQVKSNVAGEIIKLNVDEGDYVKQGQLIAEIDPTDPTTNLQQAQADLDGAEAKVAQTKQNAAMQRLQTAASIESAKQALAASKQRLVQAEVQAKVQPELTQEAINQAESNLSSAKASLEQTKSALIPQKLASVQAAYDQAKANYNQAEQNVVRQRALLNKGFVAQGQVDAAEQQYSVSKAQLDNAKRVLDTVQDQVNQDLSVAQARVTQAEAARRTVLANRVQDSLKLQDLSVAQAAVKQATAALAQARASAYQNQMKEEDIVQARAQLQRAQASEKNARTQLGYTKIIAPRAGVVVKKYVDPGSIVAGGKSSFAGSGSGVGLVDIADVTRMYALVNVDETDIAQIEVGQEVDITVDAYPDELFSGKVTKIAPQALVAQNVTTIPVTIEVEAPDRRLRPSMNVTCEFITGRASNVLMVPNEAIKETDGIATVTLMENGKQVTRTVETGLTGADNTEIKNGIKVGEKVVTAVIERTTVQAPMGGGMGMGGFGGPPGGGRGH